MEENSNLDGKNTQMGFLYSVHANDNANNVNERKEIVLSAELLDHQVSVLTTNFTSSNLRSPGYWTTPGIYVIRIYILVS